MTASSPDQRALVQALSVLAPSSVESDLLLSCLGTPDRVRQAWQRFLDAVPDPTALFRADTGRRKRLAPLLLEGLGRGAVELPSHLATVLRTASFRESLRAEAYYRIVLELVDALNEAEVPFLLLGGAALGLSDYDDPALRHSHEVDLFVAPERMARAESALASRGLRRRHKDHGRLWATLRHATGTPVRLRSRLFAVPVYQLPWDDAWSGSRSVQVQGTEIPTLGRVHALLHAAAEAAYRPDHASLTWATDLFFLSRRMDGPAWKEVAAVGRGCGVSLPLGLLLDYAREALGASVPADVTGTLVLDVDALHRDAALYGARKGPGVGASRLLAGVERVGDRVRVARWLALPSPEFLNAIAELEGGADGQRGYLRSLGSRLARRFRATPSQSSPFEAPQRT